MQKLIWQNSEGEEINLTSGNYGITEWEGFSNADLNIQSQQVPFQDGGVFLDALLEQRELSVTLAMNDEGNLETRYRLRRELIHALNPKLGEGYLIYTNDFISKRIKCVAQVPLFETHNSNDSGTPKASLAWTACNPYWEDVHENIVFIENSNIIVKNEGDVQTKVEVLMQVKNAVNPTLRNIIANSMIKINNEQSGIIYINTKNGEKTVSKKEVKSNMITPDSFDNLSEGNNNIIGRSGSDKIISSKDGLTFEIEKTFRDRFIYKIIYDTNSELYIVLLNNQEIQYSKDLINWSSVQTPALQSGHVEWSSSIAYSDNTGFVLITLAMVEGTENYVLYAWKSSDLISWTPVFSAVSYNISTINDFFYSSYVGEFIILTDKNFLHGTFINSQLTVGGQGYWWTMGISLANNCILVSNSYFYDWFSNSLIENTNGIFQIAYNTFLNVIFGTNYNGLFKTDDLTNWDSILTYETPGQSSELNYFQSLNLMRVNFENGFYYSNDCENWSNVGLAGRYISHFAYDEYSDTYYYTNFGSLYSSKNNIFTLIYTDLDTDISAIESFDEVILLGCGSSIKYSNDKGQTWNESIIPADDPDAPYDRVTKFLKVNDYYYAINGNVLLRTQNLSSWEKIIEFPSSDYERIMDFIYIPEFSGIRDLWVFATDNDTNNIIIRNIDGTFSQIFTTSEPAFNVCYSEFLNRIITTGYGNYIIDANFNCIEGSLTSSEDVIYSEKDKLAISVDEDGYIQISIDGLEWYEDIRFHDFSQIKSYKGQMRVVGSNIIDLSFKSSSNLISELNPKSNINFQLEIGNNSLISVCENDGNIKSLMAYRQKYLGV